MTKRSISASLGAVIAFAASCARAPAPSPPSAPPPASLKEAIEQCDLAAVRRFIDAGADVSAQIGSGKHPTGDTPLALALWEANKANPQPAACDIMELLIAAGAEVNALDRDGRNLLHYPHNPRAVELLLDAGAKVDVRAPEDGTTPLYRTDKLEIMQLLVPAAEDLNTVDKTGKTALDYHMQWPADRQEILTLLRDAGGLSAAEINAAPGDANLGGPTWNPIRITLRYSVHFSQIRLTATPQVVEYWQKGQGPTEERYRREVRPDQFAGIAARLLQTEPFRDRAFRAEHDPHYGPETDQAVYVLTVVFSNGSEHTRAVAHTSLYQQGKYPQLREWLEQMNPQVRFTGIAPQG